MVIHSFINTILLLHLSVHEVEAYIYLFHTLCQLGNILTHVNNGKQNNTIQGGRECNID